jgi:hypothetical protein
MGLALMIVFAFVPVESVASIGELRNQFNLHRLHNASVGYRTAFANPYSVDSWLSFTANYLYALVRLNFPALFLSKPQDYALSGMMVTYITICALGVWKGPRPLAVLSSFGLGHMLVLALFEPDNGAYLRHMSVTFIVTAPVFPFAFQHVIASLGKSRRGRRDASASVPHAA